MPTMIRSGIRFQFTRPRGARPPFCGQGKQPVKFQFTRPRGARQQVALVARRAVGVSIHAPARGATYHHAHQFRANAVSIHAPARGATKVIAQTADLGRFQFTRPRGARLVTGAYQRFPPSFQFTRPRGARPWWTRRGGSTPRFNSRAREGRDGRIRLLHRQAGVSIHAPARGATIMVGSMLDRVGLFQFTRPRGARRRLPPPRYSGRCFNSRAREGRDTKVIAQTADLGRFQFTRPRGARRDTTTMCRFAELFQFTRPRGARRSSGGTCRRARRVSIHAPARGATR